MSCDSAGTVMPQGGRLAGQVERDPLGGPRLIRRWLPPDQAYLTVALIELADNPGKTLVGLRGRRKRLNANRFVAPGRGATSSSSSREL